MAIPAKMSFELVLSQVLQHKVWKEPQKKALLCKLIPAFCTNKILTNEEITRNFEVCLNAAISHSSSWSAVNLALYAYSLLGEKYLVQLKEYLTIDTISATFSEDDVSKLTIKVMWMKSNFNLLHNDADFNRTISPILSSILENKLAENGQHSMFLAQLADLYLRCPELLPLQHLRQNFTISIMQCVASFPVPTNTETIKHMKIIGELITCLWEIMPLESILETLISMYAIISNTDTTVEVCPAMAHILSLVFPQVVEGLGPRIVADPQSSNSSFGATLNRLCHWLIAWPTAHETLVHWIRTLCKLLYHNAKNIIPSKVTFEQVPKLLDALRIPVVRPGVSSVVTLLLMSFQRSPVSFHKSIHPLVTIIKRLENESSEIDTSTLNSLVLLSHAQMTLFPGFPDLYQPLMEVLNKYDVPSDDTIDVLIKDHQWLPNEANVRSALSSKGLNKLLSKSSDATVAKLHKRSPGQRVGLKNLGNTCYMNSVIQALFMTDDFRHSVLHTYPKSNQHLLLKLQHLFTFLCFSDRHHVSPVIFHDKSRPPWFNAGMQQDCSEYLRHMLITLHEEERSGQKLPEYQERMIVESETASLASDVQPLPEDSQTEMEFEIKETKPAGTDAQDLKSPTKEKTKPEAWTDCLEDKKSLAPLNLQEVEGTSQEVLSDATSFKRKHKVSPSSASSPSPKSPKGDTSPDNDNSSDSGISGDLAEELDLGASAKEGKGLSIEEVTGDADYFVSQVHRAFGGKSSTVIKCLTCKTESIHKDVFTDINLTFQDSDQSNATRKQPERLCKTRTGETTSDLRIEDMLANYLAPERLTGENQYECDKCGGKQDAERSIEILEPPDHLILIQLRFYYDTSRGQRQKVFTNVEFAQDLVLPTKSSVVSCDETLESPESAPCDATNEELPEPFDELEGHRYALYAVVVHSGFSSEGGHYYCYARNSSIAVMPQVEREKTGDLNDWYNFNDERVTKTTFNNISRLTRTFSRDTAYLLFYKKVNPSMSAVTVQTPILEDLSRLRPDLQESLQQDNTLYKSEQESDFLRRKCHHGASMGGSNTFKRDDDEDRPPTSGCGGGPGFDMTSREVF